MLSGVFTIYPTEDRDHAALGDLEACLYAECHAHSVTGDLFMQQMAADCVQRVLDFLPPTALLPALPVFRSGMRPMRGCNCGRGCNCAAKSIS